MPWSTTTVDTTAGGGRSSSGERSSRADPKFRTHPPLGVGTGAGAGAGAPAARGLPSRVWPARVTPGTTRGTPDRFLVETVLAFPGGRLSGSAPLTQSLRSASSRPLLPSPTPSRAPPIPTGPSPRAQTRREGGSDSQQPRRPAQRRHGHPSHFQWRRFAPGLLRPRAPLLPRGKPPSVPTLPPFLPSPPRCPFPPDLRRSAELTDPCACCR